MMSLFGKTVVGIGILTFSSMAFAADRNTPIAFLDNHYDSVAAVEADMELEGNSAAQFELARTLQTGAKGVADPEQALILYHLAAENGYKPAQKYLATAYREGLMGVEKNTGEAKIWTAMYNSDWQ